MSNRVLPVMFVLLGIADSHWSGRLVAQVRTQDQLLTDVARKAEQQRHDAIRASKAYTNSDLVDRPAPWVPVTPPLVTQSTEPTTHPTIESQASPASDSTKLRVTQLEDQLADLREETRRAACDAKNRPAPQTMVIDPWTGELMVPIFNVVEPDRWIDRAFNPQAYAAKKAGADPCWRYTDDGQQAVRKGWIR